MKHTATLNVTDSDRGIIAVAPFTDIFKVSLFFTLLGLLNTVLLWPVVMLLYISGAG